MNVNNDSDDPIQAAGVTGSCQVKDCRVQPSSPCTRGYRGEENIPSCRRLPQFRQVIHWPPCTHEARTRPANIRLRGKGEAAAVMVTAEGAGTRLSRAASFREADWTGLERATLGQASEQDQVGPVWGELAHAHYSQRGRRPGFSRRLLVGPGLGAHARYCQWSGRGGEAADFFEHIKKNQDGSGRLSQDGMCRDTVVLQTLSYVPRRDQVGHDGSWRDENVFCDGLS
ncbi:hypothetical protein GWK47_021952 [Chionoecetes opilio]|uniref:Uncharacterized protein n=1 Tax=Chionoecetes opilio TaxID=41210 RepID=A0A8J4XNS0_CHIOP|nr:hypothetical protein GWK47_021952 [Chionoecetes opilio]